MPPKSKVREPSQARSKATVEAILEGASQVVRAHGLEGCSTTRIAERAGVSVGTLYQYFRSKEAVFDALIDRLLGRLAEARAKVLLERAADLQAAPDADAIGPAIQALIDQLLALYGTDPALQHQLHRYEASRGFTRLYAYQDAMQGLVAEQLTRHQHRFRPLDPALAARVIVHSTTGVVERMALEDPAMLERADVRRELAALLAGYLSPGNPVA